MKKGLVFVISGPSGSGKGTIVERLRSLYPEVGVAVSATTRQPREGEIEGVSYYYKTRETFMKMVEAGEILEYAEYGGNLYGTLKSEAEKVISGGRDVILEIEVCGGGQVKKILGDDCILIMLLPPNGAEQERRLRERGTESEEKIQIRLAQAKAELPMAAQYDYIVLNETGKQDECAEAILSIMKAAHYTEKRMHYSAEHFFDTKQDK